MNSEIDFSEYSLDELYDSASSIDREKFPERAARIDALISEKVNSLADKTAQPLMVRSEVKRFDRFAGALIGGAASAIASVPFWFFVEIDGSSGVSLSLALVSFLYGFLVFFILHGYLLLRYGQTIGKFLMGTRIENLDGSKASPAIVLFLRYLPMFVFSAIPFIGLLIAGIINPLMIFRDDRRCLHDHIANTAVAYVRK